MQTGKKQKNLLRVGIIGTIIAALCCSTPILVLLLSAIGLGSGIGVSGLYTPSYLGYFYPSNDIWAATTIEDKGVGDENV